MPCQHLVVMCNYAKIHNSHKGFAQRVPPVANGTIRGLALPSAGPQLKARAMPRCLAQIPCLAVQLNKGFELRINRSLESTPTSGCGTGSPPASYPGNSPGGSSSAASGSARANAKQAAGVIDIRIRMEQHRPQLALFW